MQEHTSASNLSQAKTNQSTLKNSDIKRVYILYIINILRIYSSKEHPMSIPEIIKKLDETYDPEEIIESNTDQSNGRFINRSTIQRQLETLTCCADFLNDMDSTDFFSLEKWENRPSLNFKIHVMEKLPTANAMYKDVTEQVKQEYIDRLDEKESAEFKGEKNKKSKKPKSKMLYYYYESSISTNELNELIHMVEAYPNYTTEEVTARIKKIRSLAPGYFYNEKQNLPMIHQTNRLHADPKYVSTKYQYARNTESDVALQSYLQWNLHLLYQYIHDKKDIKIVYGYYNEQKQLVARTGYQDKPHRITPYHIICSNGQYYLVAYNPYRDQGTEDDNGIMQYRIDRIIEIHPLDDNDKPGNIGPKSREISYRTALDYAKLHPFMMAGRTETVSFMCRRSSIIVNKLIDFFGYDGFQITNPDSKLFSQLFHGTKEQIGDWINVRCEQVAHDSVRIWAKQFSCDCVVYQPANLRQEIKQDLEKTLKFYQ